MVNKIFNFQFSIKMSFGISNNVKSRVVRECTPELFHQAMRSELVAEVCAEIADGLERLRRGELTKEEYDTLKAGLKKRLPIFTPHATFRNGRRLNADAIPSGLSMYDVDHINDPRGYWEQKRQELEARGVMRYVVLAHQHGGPASVLHHPRRDGPGRGAAVDVPADGRRKL